MAPRAEAETVKRAQVCASLAAVERREAQAPTSLGSRPGQGLANLARPARRYRKARHGVPRTHPKGVSQAPGASRRSITPPCGGRKKGKGAYPAPRKTKNTG